MTYMFHPYPISEYRVRNALLLVENSGGTGLDVLSMDLTRMCTTFKVRSSSVLLNLPAEWDVHNVDIAYTGSELKVRYTQGICPFLHN